MAFACAYALVGDAYLAEDIAQEAFITAWQKLSQLREIEAFPGWFKRIVLTHCNRLLRGKRVTPRTTGRWPERSRERSGTTLARRKTGTTPQSTQGNSALPENRASRDHALLCRRIYADRHWRVP